MDYDISFLRSTLNKGLSKYQTCLKAIVDTGSEKVDLEVTLLSSQKYHLLLYLMKNNNSVDNWTTVSFFSVTLSIHLAQQRVVTKNRSQAVETNTAFGDFNWNFKSFFFLLNSCQNILFILQSKLSVVM